MKVERFWILEPLEAGRSSGNLLGVIKPMKGSVSLWGAQFTLLCDREQQANMDILAAVSPHPNDKHKTQDDLKSKPIYFYAQRDAYALCSGIKDLVHLVMLPEPVVASHPVYIKGFCGNYNREKSSPSRYDIIVDVFLSEESVYEVEDRVPEQFRKGGF